MDNKKTPANCLFTGVPLEESTKVEHTIPAGLGGRITSTRVTSTRFNEATSDKFDKPFVSQYQPILVRLAPLLPSSLKNKTIQMHSRDGSRKYLFKNGSICVDGMIITERDKDNKPRSCLTTVTPDSITRVNKQFNWNPLYTIAIAPQELPDNIVFNRFNFTAEAHISALKSILISFDEMLTRANGFVFTRDSALKPLCQFLQNVVLESPDNYFSELDRYYWGLQLDKSKIVEQVLNAFHYKRGPFEHIMIVSSCSVNKMLYGIWDILGIETIGFCFCPAGLWHGPSFSAVIANPILRDTQSPTIKIGNELISHQLCRRTQYKCFCLNSDPPDSPEDRYFQAISKSQAYQQAVYLVETTAEDHVLDKFKYMAQKLESNKTLLDMLIKRIEGLYSEKNLQTGIGAKIHDTAQKVSTHWIKYFAKDFGVLPCEIKHLFFIDYRNLLEEIYDPLNPPGHIESGVVSIVSE